MSTKTPVEYLEISFKWRSARHVLKMSCDHFDQFQLKLFTSTMLFIHPDDLKKEEYGFISLTELEKFPEEKRLSSCIATFKMMEEVVDTYVFHKIIEKLSVSPKDDFLVLFFLNFITQMYKGKVKQIFFYPFIDNTELSFVKKIAKSTCIECGVPSNTKFQKCSGCKTTKMYYCSSECQKKHWPIHKHFCERNTNKCCACCYSFPRSTKFQKCGGCKSTKVYYCSQECQKLHWPSHKQYCEKSHKLKNNVSSSSNQ